MTFAYKGSGGTAVSTTLNQQSTTLTTTMAGAVGDLAVLVYAVDNNAITDGDENAVTSVVCGTGNIWIKAKEFTNGQAAIQAGATCGIWFCNLFKPQPVGTVITISFGDPPARDASAFTLGYFTEAVNFTGVVEATNALANDSQTAGSLDAVSSNIPCLRIRATASESNSTVAWTKTAAFDGLFAQAVTNSGGGAVNQGIRAEYDISTGTGLASLPTGGAGGATDHASIYVAWREVPTQFLTPSLYDDVVTCYPPYEMSYYFLSGYVADGDVTYATGVKTTYSVLGNQVYSDSDNFAVPAVVRGNVVVAAGPVIDVEEIFDVVVIPNARSEIGIVEDEDIFHAPDVATIWIVFDAFVDSDDFTTDTVLINVNIIRHSVISFDEIIEPSIVSMRHCNCGNINSDDQILGSNSQSTNNFGPDFQEPDDSFFVSTFIADLNITAPFVSADTVFYSATVTDIGTNFAILPIRYSDADTIRQVTLVHFPAPYLQPVRHVDNDVVHAPTILRSAMTLAPSRPVDNDSFNPPFIGRRRSQLRSGVGVIKGTIDNVVDLIGDRDKAA